MNACEDNCCRNSGWTIAVDPASYEKYKAMDNETGKFILSCIEKKDDIIKMKEFDDGKCPLLVGDGLCLIHRDLGPEYLCITCSSYPKSMSYFDGRHEYWLSLSCPEVVRQVLYREETANILEVEIKSNLAGAEATNLHKEKSKIRKLLFEIAKCEKYSFMEKLIYMGLFMRSVSKLPKDGGFNQAIDEPIAIYCGNLGAKSIFGGLLNSLNSTDKENRTDILLELSKLSATIAAPVKNIPKDMQNAPFYMLMENFHNDVINDNAKKYLSAAFDRLIVPYVNENPHVFNNYLMYVLLSSQFLMDTDDFAEAYAGFAGELCAMLIFTAGLFHENSALSHEDMVVSIYLFHRRISHSKKLRTELANMFMDSSLASILSVCAGIH